MCGLAGVAGVKVEPAALRAMAAAIRHRGPDDEGFYQGPGIGLAFRRLAIVDLDGGRQPMSNEDGQVHLVFNGEIYDHAELRRQLQIRGHVFVTDHSDTEVLVHGWEEWGCDLFGKLNGMFAIAIWEDATRTLILARDRYGIKPLYYAPLAGGNLVFGSEIKAILASGLVPCEASPSGILEYFSFQNLWQTQTMFRGICQLEPGTILIWRHGGITRRRYWDITFPRWRRESLAELAEEHRAILLRALRRQLAADVPVKTYLSGGIDSTAITVGANRIDPNTTAYSCIFDLTGVGADRSVDEREYSRLVARTHAIERIEYPLTPEHLPRCLLDYARALEDLRMGMGYPVYWMAWRVAQDAKVVLSGTGGDEFHGGYAARYAAVTPSAQGRSLWRGAKELLRWTLARVRGRPYHPRRSPRQVYGDILNFLVKPGQLHEVFTPEFLAQAKGFDARQVIDDFLHQCPSTDWRDRVLYVDAKTYLAGLLTLEDKLSMAHALETRVPLLDNELVDFVLEVPFEYLWQGETGKRIFRESVRPWVPPEIYAKPKMGFGPPEGSWYRGRLRPWLLEVLAPARVRARGVLQPAFVQRLLEEHLAGQHDWCYWLWSLVNFESWCCAFGMYGARESLPLAA